MKPIFLVAAVSVLTIACDVPATAPYSYTELVMTPGMTIEATTKSGTINISYVDALTRRYRGEGFDETRALTPRKERFGKQLGAYDPGEHYFWQPWPRIVIQESQLHFGSSQEAKKHWVLQSFVGNSDWVFDDQGFVVSYYMSPGSEHVVINVFQIFVSGKAPSKFQTSGNNNLIIRRDE